jgi:hypothetical protein
LAIFFQFPSEKFLLILFKILLSDEQRQKQLDVSFFWCLFPCTFWILCNLLLLFTVCQVWLLVKETAEIETGMAEKSGWERQKLDLVWRNRKKICQIIKDYFYLPFFLLIILWISRWLRPFISMAYNLDRQRPRFIAIQYNSSSGSGGFSNFETKKSNEVQRRRGGGSSLPDGVQTVLKYVNEWMTPPPSITMGSVPPHQIFG